MGRNRSVQYSCKTKEACYTRPVKDYYSMLGVKSNDGEKEIKSAFRRLAMKYHPDHANGDKFSEERFKEISEAYAVLTDPVRRSEYDRGRSFAPRSRNRSAGTNGPSFAQEDIFQDFFNRSQQNQFMRELMKEFQRRGMRADPTFFNQVFFGGRGVFMGGATFQNGARTRVNPGARRPQTAVRRQAPTRPETRPLESVKSLVGKSWRLLQKSVLAPFAHDAGRGKSLSYKVTIDPLLALQGGKIIIAHPIWPEDRKLSVRIPPRTQPGARLRLKGQGEQGKKNRPPGDLFLEISIKR